MVTTKQLASLGLSRRWIEHAVAVGWLHRVHRGVYAVGHPALSYEGRMLAAALAVGADAALSHGFAASAWRYISVARGPIDVIAPGRSRRSRPGIRVHQPRDLDPADVCRHRDLPVTTPERTLFDLAGRLSRVRLKWMFQRAERLEVIDDERLRGLLGRIAGRPGSKLFAELALELGHGIVVLRSGVESRFLELCREGGLPLPAMNLNVVGWEVDALWVEQRLIVELDSFHTHGSEWDFERDRERDAELSLAGYHVIRITDRRLDREPLAVAAQVRGLLAARASLSSRAAA